jgi:hypothetical protein
MEAIDIKALNSYRRMENTFLQFSGNINSMD